MTNSNEIVWFRVNEALPAPGKEVLVSEGAAVSASSVQSVETRPDRTGWDVYWKGGIKVTKWAFMPKAPETEPTQDGPSIW